MTPDPTVVSLCRQYQRTGDRDALLVALDRMMELGDQEADSLRWHWADPNMRQFTGTVDYVIGKYGDGHE